MKRCKTIPCWTDNPFEELGDELYKTAPIRHVVVVSYDQNKYATIIVDGLEIEVKRGYLYSIPARCGTKRVVNRRKLERMFPAARSEK